MSVSPHQEPKPVLIAIRYNDYARATMVDGSKFDADDRAFPDGSMENAWLVFSGISEAAYGARENQHALLTAALGATEVSPENRRSIDAPEHYLVKTIFDKKKAESAKPVKMLATMIATGPCDGVPIGLPGDKERRRDTAEAAVQAMFPNADVHIMKSRQEVSYALDTLQVERSLDRIHTASVSTRGK